MSVPNQAKGPRTEWVHDLRWQRPDQKCGASLTEMSRTQGVGCSCVDRLPLLASTCRERPTRTLVRSSPCAGRLACLLAAYGVLCALHAQRSDPHQRFVGQYCTACHNEDAATAGLALDAAAARPVPENAALWERVVGKLRSRQMPPIGAMRPDESTYDDVVRSLAAALDEAAAARPDPGRPGTPRGLRRASPAPPSDGGRSRRRPQRPARLRAAPGVGARPETWTGRPRPPPV